MRLSTTRRRPSAFFARVRITNRLAQFQVKFPIRIWRRKKSLAVTLGAEVTSQFIIPMNRYLFCLSYWTFLSTLCEAAEWCAFVICNDAKPSKPIINPVNDSKLMPETVKVVGSRTTVVIKPFGSILSRRNYRRADRTRRLQKTIICFAVASSKVITDKLFPQILIAKDPTLKTTPFIHD